MTSGPPREAPPFGGWLLLVAIQMIGAPAALIYHAVADYTLLENEAPDLIGSTWFQCSYALRGFLLALDVGAATLFFQKLRSAPRLLQAYFAAAAAGVLALQMLDRGFLGVEWDVKALVAGLGFPLVWIAYFRFSKRVQATFVR